jgi:ABC-type Fe3+/spermidine/putrescine transport system ATPase subunit
MSEGRIEQVGTPLELYRRPATPFVADFVGETNHLHGEIVVHAGRPVFRIAAKTGLAEFELPSGAPVQSGAATLMIRPESVRLSANDTTPVSLAGTVEQVALMGDRYAVIVAAGPLRLQATLLNEPSRMHVPSPGEQVSLAWRAEDAIVFAGHV